MIATFTNAKEEKKELAITAGDFLKGSEHYSCDLNYESNIDHRYPIRRAQCPQVVCGMTLGSLRTAYRTVGDAPHGYAVLPYIQYMETIKG